MMDFFVRIGEKEEVNIYLIPKYMVIKTIYPFSVFFKDVLKIFTKEIRKEKLLFFKQM